MLARAFDENENLTQLYEQRNHRETSAQFCDQGKASYCCHLSSDEFFEIMFRNEIDTLHTLELVLKRDLSLCLENRVFKCLITHKKMVKTNFSIHFYFKLSYRQPLCFSRIATVDVNIVQILFHLCLTRGCFTIYCGLGFWNHHFYAVNCKLLQKSSERIYTQYSHCDLHNGYLAEVIWEYEDRKQKR